MSDGVARCPPWCSRALAETRAIALLAGPLIVSQVSQVAMGFTDTVMAGRLSAADLAAIEVALFSAVSLLMGTLGVQAVAAHQIALNYSALMFMVPLGISMAVTIRVGHAAGARDAFGVRCAGWVGIGLGALAMTVSAAVMLSVPEAIVALYIDDAAVRALAVGLLVMAALFQIADGVQVCALGALRGIKDTLVPMAMTFVSYWVLGLSLAYLLGIRYGFGPRGLWAGLVITWWWWPCCSPRDSMR